MFCKVCGTKIPDDAQFCPYCGEVLELEEKSKIETPALDNKLGGDFDLHLDWVSETSVLRQGMRTKIYLQVAKVTSAPVYGAEVQLYGPPQVDIVINSRKIHPKKTTNRIFFPISANEPGIFTLSAILRSNAGHRIEFPFKIRVEPTKTLYREEKPKKTIINDISMTDFKLSLKGGDEIIFLHQDIRKNFYLIVEKKISLHINNAEVQLSGPPHVEIAIRPKKIEATRRINRLDFTITARELGVFTLTSILTSDAGHRITHPFKIRVEPTNFIYGDSPTIDSSSEPDFKLSLKGGDEIIFLHKDIRKNFDLIVERNISSPVYGGEVQLSGPPHIDIIIQSRKMQANIKKNLVSFTISAKELGVFTLTATLTSDAGHQIEFPFKIRVEPTDFIYGESPTINSSSESDFKLYLDGGIETVFLHQKMRKNIYLIVEKNISSPVYGAEVQLSGPSHVDIIIKSRKLRPKKKTNKIIFPISARELGLFTLTATLTSDAGHQIVYSFIIRVEPTKYSYAEETRAKPSIRAPETSSIGTGRIVFFAIFGLIGGILLISGIINIPNLLESVFSMDGDAYPIAIPLVLSGFIVLFIAFAIGTKGKCCGCCDCCDYCS